MNYPVELTFKLIAIASQIYIRDSGGQLLGYVKQKLFKLKEDINVFADEGQNRLMYNIKADRVLDFSPQFTFTDASGKVLGAVKRQGMRSIWRANYDILDGTSNPVMNVREESGWVKVVDSLLGEVPVLGMFTGYFFHPSYIVTKTNGTPVARLTKRPAFFEGKFRLDSLTSVDQDDEVRILLGLLTIALMERSRG